MYAFLCSESHNFVCGILSKARPKSIKIHKICPRGRQIYFCIIACKEKMLSIVEYPFRNPACDSSNTLFSSAHFCNLVVKNAGKNFIYTTDQRYPTIILRVY